ncbi:VOC family protein [Hymenobacter sp. BT730]|uniref:VOC family protein n=1 Tax=Hymenobacter sp. BT730 TaxID=3063332 RepID=UPI0026E041FD|nr:VOC family protein [Hymenobacter sp. BT730]
MNLNQVTVPSLNLPVAIRFYQLLGLELIVEALPHYARFVCPHGETTFSLHQVENLPSAGGIWVYFECTNLDAQVQRLSEAGVVFEELPTNKPWLWREARLKDPDQNQIILYFAGDNRINPPWRLPS